MLVWNGQTMSFLFIFRIKEPEYLYGMEEEIIVCGLLECFHLSNTFLYPENLIVCSTMNPRESSVTRIRDFIDRGCSRPEVGDYQSMRVYTKEFRLYCVETLRFCFME